MRAFGLVLLLLFFSSPAFSESLVKLAKEEKSQIVQIVVPQPNAPGSMVGSGFWVDQAGYIATCWHVVSANPQADIQIKIAADSFFDLSHNRVVDANWQDFVGRVVFSDPENDLAIIKLDSVSPFVSHPRPLVQIDEMKLEAHYSVSTIQAILPQAGEGVLIAGYPLGSAYSVVQAGTVAATAANLPHFAGKVKLLISAVANHGNSGGPVFNDQGHVIGVLEGEFRSQPESERTGLEIVIPSQYLSNLMKENKLSVATP